MNAVQFGTGAVVSQGVTSLPSHILTPGEHIFYETKPILWPILIRPALIIVVGLIIFIAAPTINLEFIGDISAQISLGLIRLIIGWFGITLILIGLLAILVRFVRWKYTFYVVTNRRILNQTGIIGRSYVGCPLNRIQKVILDISIFGRILGFGTIHIATAGIKGTEISWKYLKEPIEAHRRLNKAIEQSIRYTEQPDKGEL